MYAWIWRKLPFGQRGKLAGSVLLATAAVALLWYVVFPWAEPLLPFTGGDVQVTQDSGSPKVPGPAGTPGGPGAGNPGVTTGGPTEDGHELHYNTERNNAPPTTPSTR
ncbi:MAG TPA: hypothetical protein VF462_13350 [Micromonosporaceae bacterium]